MVGFSGEFNIASFSICKLSCMYDGCRTLSNGKKDSKKSFI